MYSLLYFGAFDELTKRYSLIVSKWIKQDEMDFKIQKPKEIPDLPMEVIAVFADPPELTTNVH